MKKKTRKPANGGNPPLEETRNPAMATDSRHAARNWPNIGSGTWGPQGGYLGPIEVRKEK